jgi:hypothetical protein
MFKELSETEIEREGVLLNSNATSAKRRHCGRDVEELTVHLIAEGLREIRILRTPG